MLTGLNEYGRLRRVAMRKPADAMIDQATVDREWRDLNYHTAPDFRRAVAEHATS
jgi:N-dimethylarginine dimethylaminohydrolase